MDSLVRAKNLIGEAKNIWILSSKNIQGDSLGSSLALFYTLKKIGKNVKFLIKEIPEKLRFLTFFSSQEGKNFIISINEAEKKISEMRYEKNGRELKIYLALSQGEIKENDISFCSLNHSKNLLKENQDYSGNPDLIITIGITTLNALANFFEENQKIFYKVHILNIDNQPANERFGEINLVEPDSSSIAEIATDLIKIVDDGIFDENITTSLLAGIIISSKNFRDLKTNLKTFKTASFLIENGANYQRIIQHLYKEKEVSQIKLWGRILEKLNFNKEKELYLIPLKEKDFQESGTKPKDLGNIIEELKFNPGILPNFNRVFPLLVLFETHSSPSCVRGIFYSKNLNSIDNIIKNFQGTQKGNWVLFTIKEKGLEKAEQKVLQLLE